MRYLDFEILLILKSVPWCQNQMKRSRFRLKPHLNPSYTNLSNWYGPVLFCVFHEQSLFASTWGTDFRHFTATDARFSFREFSRIKSKSEKKPYQVSKFTIRHLWLKYEDSHFSVDVPPLTRSWKKVVLKNWIFWRVWDLGGATKKREPKRFKILSLKTAASL